MISPLAPAYQPLEFYSSDDEDSSSDFSGAEFLATLPGTTIQAPEVVVAEVEENDSDAKIIEFPGAEEASEDFRDSACPHPSLKEVQRFYRAHD